MKEYTTAQFLTIVSLSLVAICAVTLGVSTACVRYKQIAIAFFLLMLLPTIIFAKSGSDLSTLMTASEAGFKSLCTERSGPAADEFLYR